MTVLRAAAETHTGYVRAINQDQAVISGDLVAVADGMGGHLGGEVAARTAIEELVAAFRRDRTPDGLVGAVRKANRAIWRRSRVDRKLHGMGTTLTAAALILPVEPDESSAAHVTLVNIGDSRAYRLAPGSTELQRLTEDHTVVEEMVRQGELTPEEAAVHPHRHVLTRALGIDPEVGMDVWDLRLEPGSRLLLCSDGLTNELADDEIADVLAKEQDLTRAAHELVGRALGHGGMDNVTVVVVDLVDEAAAGEPPVQLVPARAAALNTTVDEATDITQAVAVTPADDGSGRLAVSGDDLGVGEERPMAGELPRKGGSPDSEATTRAMSTAEIATVVGDEAAQSGKGSSGRRSGRTMAERAAGFASGAAGGALLAGGAARMTGVAGGDGAGSSGGYRDAGGATTTQHHRPVVLVPHSGLARALRDQIVTFRVALFVLLLAATIGGMLGVVIWFNQSSFYVGLDGNRVAIYQGRPGGMLWFKPQLIDVSRVKTRKLLASTVSELKAGVTESSLAAARQLVTELAKEKSFGLLGLATSTLPASTAPPSTAYTPSTTRPASTTTTTRPASTTTTTRPASTTTTTRPASTTTTTRPASTTTTTSKTG